jgi:hypothetical protein
MAMVNAKGEEELIGRLGRATAARWNRLPLYAQNDILNHAFAADAKFEGVDIREALTSFLERDLTKEYPYE